MRYLKTFNESGNAKFDWLKKQSNERYIDLMYILQSDLFDEYNIIPKSGERFDDENYPEHKFWTFRLVGDDDVEDSSDNNTNDYITSIIVYNISSEEKDSFLNSLIEIKDKVKDLIGKELIIEESKIDTISSTVPPYYDYIIKLGEEFKFKKDLLQM